MEPTLGEILNKINIKPIGTVHNPGANSPLSLVGKTLPMQAGPTIPSFKPETTGITGTSLLLRTVHGDPKSRPIAEWSDLASKAKRRWLQGKGTIQAQIASVEYCYFSSVARWLKNQAWWLVHPIQNMAYPAELVPYINHGGLFK